MAKAKKLPSGNWRVLVYAGTDANGKRKYESFTAETKSEAEFLASEYKLKRPSRLSMTLGDAIDNYISNREGVLSPKTVREYKKYRVNYAQQIMDIKISNITSEILQAEISRESTRLSPKSVKNVYGLISASLSTYLPDKKFKVLLPKKIKNDIVIPDQETLKVLFDSVEGTMLELPVYLGACLGMRRSEISALDLHNSVDYENNTVTINRAMVLDSDNNWILKAPKAYSSYRTIEAPDFVIEKLRKAADDPNYVMLKPANISNAFAKKIKSLKLGSIRFHDLRHYYASMMLSLGVPDKYAMERMGHATPNMLKTVYQHTMKEKQDEVTSTINGYLAQMQHDMQHDTK